jgi:L-amino acid N-acyltransferase YncA
MSIVIRPYASSDEEPVRSIWNAVVEEHNAFPQTEPLKKGEADAFFRSQTYTGVAEDEDHVIIGMYILHPNNVGHCGHLANASYAVRKDIRGRHIGEALVRDCLAEAKEKGFEVLQFNAVVAENAAAIHLYEKLGFVRLGTVPKGFKRSDTDYSDIILYYRTL